MNSSLPEEKTIQSPPTKDKAEIFKNLKAAAQMMEQQKNQAHQRLVKALQDSPIPLDITTKEKIAQLGPQEFWDVLRYHSGFKLYEKLQSYKTALQVFESASQDLLEAINHFEEISKDTEFFNRANEAQIEKIEKNIQKEVFAATNAAHSLVEHSQELNKLAKCEEYGPQLKAIFLEDGLHEFIVEFRNVLHHANMVKAGWSVRHDRSGRSASFTVPKLPLKMDFEQNKRLQEKDKLKTKTAIMSYLATAPENIDLRVIFTEYKKRADTFHKWLSTQLEADAYRALRDVEGCISLNRRFSSKISWGIVLGQIVPNSKKSVNPYDYLPKYLKKEELAVVQALKKGSKAQIDKIIEFIDEHHACDDNLRKAVYDWFKKYT